MAEHESRSPTATQAPRGAAPTSAAVPRATMLGACRILGGLPRGLGRAEITIETIRHPEVAVGMTGILMASDATFEITAVRPGVAKAMLTGKGVEKLDYRTRIAFIEPTEDYRAANAAAGRYQGPLNPEAARQRALGRAR